MPHIADYRGARGSSTGDQFHELWALEQILALLQPKTELAAVTVEGVPATKIDSESEPHWDGVDCGLFFGGERFETAEQLDLVQLKYSGNPSVAWSVSRLTDSTAKKGNNSVLRKLADGFTKAQKRLKADAQLRIRLVSNQSISGIVLKVFAEGARGGKISDEIKANYQTIKQAIGLSGKALVNFFNAVDFTECGTDSRFSHRERVLLGIANLIEGNASADYAELTKRIRELMLPERTRELITFKTVLSWFDVADPDALFPCPQKLNIIENPIVRDATKQLLEAMFAGNRLICLHGPGGCGKTTTLQQIGGLLPTGSCLTVYDCFGGGQYLFSNDKRHLPENAFLQIINDIALVLGTPFLIPRGERQPFDVRRFIKRLHESASVLGRAYPHALLVIMIDAADNAVTATAKVAQVDPCFVHELCSADIHSFPANVRIVIGSRTARKTNLNLPQNTPEILCPPFSPDETVQFVRTYWPQVTDEWAADFHQLSHGIPRVQGYAAGIAGNDPSKAISALQPGKGLNELLRGQFDFALKKIGQPELFSLLTSALAVLRPPIPAKYLADALGVTSEQVNDLINDLLPGIKVSEEGILIADEDFEDFIKDEAKPQMAVMKNRVADNLLQHHATDAYAAIHVADALVAASRNSALLPLIEQSSSLKIIPDPVIRREIHVRRLRLALHACRQTGNITDSIKTIIVSADANKDEASLQEVLSKNPELAVWFAWPTLRRLVLADSDNVRYQGSILAQDAARAARVGDRTTARERLIAHDAWLQRRNEMMAGKGIHKEWIVTDDDIAARAEAIFRIVNAEYVLSELSRWSPKDIPIRVALRVIPTLVHNGQHERLQEVLNGNLLKEPWNLLLATPLAFAGFAVDAAILERSLARLRRAHIPNNAMYDTSASGSWKQQFFGVVLTACELATWSGVDNGVIKRVLTILNQSLEKRFYVTQPQILDAAIRIWLLERFLDAGEISIDAYLTSVSSEELCHPPTSGDSETNAEKRERDERYERFSLQVKAIFPLYESRLSFITRQNSSHLDDNTVKELLKGIDASDYRFDREYWAKDLRLSAAKSVLSLMTIPGIPAPPLFGKSVEILNGKYKNQFGTDAIPLLRLLLLRQSEHSLVLETVTNRLKGLEHIKCASSEKTEALLSYSRLLLPISPVDAEVLFSEAIELTKEIDHEAYDQINLLNALAVGSISLSETEQRRCAAESYRFVSGAAERLDYDGFPWETASSALARLSITVGMAAISRWADEGTCRLNITLPSLLIEGVSENKISPAVVTALAILLQYPDEDLAAKAVEKARSTGAHLRIASVFAKDWLLYASTKSRLKFAGKILSLIDSEEISQYPDLVSLQNTVKFLEQLPTVISEESELEFSNNYSPDDENAKTTNYKFDLKGRRFITAEAIQSFLKEVITDRRQVREGEVLEEMRKATQVADRVAFLNALVDVELEYFAARSRAEVLVKALKSWKGPAIERWKTENLSHVIIRHFASLVRWIEERDSLLPELLSVADINSTERLNLIVEGIEKSASELGSRTLYALIRFLVADLTGEQLASLISWYVDRLAARIPVDDRHVLDVHDVPAEIPRVVGRFLFNQMADIDVRVRWRAIHALRRMAHLQMNDVFDAVVSCYHATEENTFQAKEPPFYWLAARLWLVMGLNRIASETPAMVLPHISLLADIATDSNFPHILIHEHAKQAVLKLIATDNELKTTIDFSAICIVNVSESTTNVNRYPYRSYQWEDVSDRRFHFDSMDTLPYWYEYILRVFPTVDKNHVLDLAENWIVDNWKAPVNAHYWDLEPRKARYDERRYNLWSHRHGQMPEIERHATYLEWHAMSCVIGELLKTHPISTTDSFYDSFESWLADKMPTFPDIWFSDLRQPTPLDRELWEISTQKEDEWLNSVTSGQCIEKLGVHSEGNSDWIVVACGYDAQIDGRRESTHAYSAMIATGDIPLLFNALENEEFAQDFYVPTEDNDHDDDDSEVSLTPWLVQKQGEMLFDRSDPLLHEVFPLSQEPGQILTEHLGLNKPSSAYKWHSRKMSGEVSFVGELWSDRRERDDNGYQKNSGTNGWRLWMRKEHLGVFLKDKQMHLIYEVKVNREIYDRFSYEREMTRQKKHEFKAILVFDNSGYITDNTEKIRTWNVTEQ